MAELELKVTQAQTLTVARAEGTPALGSNKARIVIDTAFSNLEVAQALRELAADAQAVFQFLGGGRFSASAFADTARFDDGSSFSDQLVAGII